MPRSMNSTESRNMIFRYILDSVHDCEAENMNDADKAAYLWARFESEYNHANPRNRDSQADRLRNPSDVFNGARYCRKLGNARH